jgi:hypothetical protein
MTVGVLVRGFQWLTRHQDGMYISGCRCGHGPFLAWVARSGSTYTLWPCRRRSSYSGGTVISVPLPTYAYVEPFQPFIHPNARGRFPNHLTTPKPRDFPIFVVYYAARIGPCCVVHLVACHQSYGPSQYCMRGVEDLSPASFVTLQCSNMDG